MQGVAEGEGKDVNVRNTSLIDDTPHRRVFKPCKVTGNSEMSLYLNTAGKQKPYSKGPPIIMKMKNKNKNKKQVWQVYEDSPNGQNH